MLCPVAFDIPEAAISVTWRVHQPFVDASFSAEVAMGDTAGDDEDVHALARRQASAGPPLGSWRGLRLCRRAALLVPVSGRTERRGFHPGGCRPAVSDRAPTILASCIPSDKPVRDSWHGTRSPRQHGPTPRRLRINARQRLVQRLSGTALLAKSANAAAEDLPGGVASAEVRRRLPTCGPNAMPNSNMHTLRITIENSRRQSH